MATTRYETPKALRHDASTLIEDAKALVNATSEIADEKVAEARKRLESAIASGKAVYNKIQDRAREGIQAADECVREHPYQSLAVALGVGALIGYLLGRRGGES